MMQHKRYHGADDLNPRSKKRGPAAWLSAGNGSGSGSDGEQSDVVEAADSRSYPSALGFGDFKGAQFNPFLPSNWGAGPSAPVPLNGNDLPGGMKFSAKEMLGEYRVGDDDESGLGEQSGNYTLGSVVAVANPDADTSEKRALRLVREMPHFFRRIQQDDGPEGGRAAYLSDSHETFTFPGAVDYANNEGWGFVRGSPIKFMQLFAYGGYLGSIDSAEPEEDTASGQTPVCRFDTVGDERVKNLWAHDPCSFGQGCHLWLVVRRQENPDADDHKRPYLLKAETFASYDILDGRSAKFPRDQQAQLIYIGVTSYPANGSVMRLVPKTELEEFLGMKGTVSARVFAGRMARIPSIHVLLGVGRATALGAGGTWSYNYGLRFPYYPRRDAGGDEKAEALVRPGAGGAAGRPDIFPGVRAPRYGRGLVPRRGARRFGHFAGGGMHNEDEEFDEVESTEQEAPAPTATAGGEQAPAKQTSEALASLAAASTAPASVPAKPTAANPSSAASSSPSSSSSSSTASTSSAASASRSARPAQAPRRGGGAHRGGRGSSSLAESESS